VEIRAVTAGELDPFVHHLERQLGESGQGGLPVFSPFARGAHPRVDQLRPPREVGLGRTVDEPGWWRMWGAWDRDRIVGSCELAGGVVDSELHRASLMMGLERSHYGRGGASRLLETAIAWAEAEPTLAWIHLTVFTGNRPAIRLYERFGFARRGVVEDRFRVDGEVIDELQMVRRLIGRAPPAGRG
jgi:GNAT superfamily N-acetyltransferase